MKILSIHLLLLVLVQFANAQRAVIRGDFADPSVIKVGKSYYAAATSSNWAPAYPVMKSKDLKNWKQTGSIFPDLTSWADYYYWAPELNYDNGKVYAYYTAHKKGGNLCIGVASADSPEGPFKDHGPLVCQEAGSIDGFPIRDENNKLYLIWKEDGNSIGQPTPIWIQALNEERTQLTGEKKELFRNDKPWEGNLVEGVSVIKNNGYFYAIYAAAGCCGAGCTYATGIARAKNLMGPWEKYAANPILTGQGDWICPGHGTAIMHKGKNYFMYHAYDKTSTQYTGRQALIRGFEFTPDNWLRFTDEYLSPSNKNLAYTSTDNFDKKSLNLQWSWSVFNKPEYELKNGRLALQIKDEREIFIARRIDSPNYQATVETVPGKNPLAGVALIGDEKNLIYAVAKQDSIHVTIARDGARSSLGKFPVAAADKHLFLKMDVKNNKEISFSYSLNGDDFTKLDITMPDISYLPPWDRAVRAGILAKGVQGDVAVVEGFVFKSE
ncbi:family 43 glycosylhydrolase [Dyadobacter sediminis]|uniref:Glycoside hydrolase n=1 Tax=Dyadobacter sediminis TaxID=1493691 RepID=A0A5R9KJJ8_9BACT|nr:family 43 glycosylhydrolase [Dyadobacter sediminis]TLU96383.1 glycoside hydrolase [Dyadobacter sediminis]GGB81786.1 beta-xylosidase [Dyadobacter sediminis]